MAAARCSALVHQSVTASSSVASARRCFATRVSLSVRSALPPTRGLVGLGQEPQTRTAGIVAASRGGYDWEAELDEFYDDDLDFEPSRAPVRKSAGKGAKKGKGGKGYSPAEDVYSMNAIEDAMYDDDGVVQTKKGKGKKGKARRQNKAALRDEDYYTEGDMDQTYGYA